MAKTVKSGKRPRRGFEDLRDPGVKALWEEFEQSTDLEDIVDVLQRIVQQDPLEAKALPALMAAYERLERPEAALMAAREALTLAPDRKDMLEAVIRLGVRAGKVNVALRAARRLVDLEPDGVDSAFLVAGLYGLLGLEGQSQRWGQRLSEIAPLKSRFAWQLEKVSILSLRTIASGSLKYLSRRGGVSGSATEGHNNMLAVVDRRHMTVHQYAVDGLKSDSEQIRKMPKFHVLLNGITDPDGRREALELAAGLCERLQERSTVPVINHPRAVLACTRERNARLFQGREGLVAPKTAALGPLTGDIGDTVRRAAEEYGIVAP